MCRAPVEKRRVIRAITLLYCQDSLSNVGAEADCFRIEVKPLPAPALARSEPSNGDKWQFNLRRSPSLTIENNPRTFEWSAKLDNFRVCVIQRCDFDHSRSRSGSTPGTAILGLREYSQKCYTRLPGVLPKSTPSVRF